MLSRRYTPPLHPASILDNLSAQEMRQLALCGHDSFPPSVGPPPREDLLAYAAETASLAFRSLPRRVSTYAATVSSSSSLKTATPARPLATCQQNTEVATAPVSSVSPPAATVRQSIVCNSGSAARPTIQSVLLSRRAAFVHLPDFIISGVRLAWSLPTAKAPNAAGTLGADGRKNLLVRISPTPRSQTCRHAAARSLRGVGPGRHPASGRS